MALRPAPLTLLPVDGGALSVGDAVVVVPGEKEVCERRWRAFWRC